MSALDRALIKAYRADIRGGANRSTAGGFLRANPDDDLLEATPDTAVHPSEPALRGPHFRIKPNEQAYEEASTDVAESTVGTNVALAASFRVDVGIASPSPNVRLTYASDPATEHRTPPEPYLLRKHKSEVVSRLNETVAAEASPVHLTSQPLASFNEAQATAEDARPQLVVDAFAWTEACDQLCQRSRGIFDGFLAELLSQISAGKKRIGIVGLDTAAGGTTVTLCLARLLAAKGLKTALIDADFDQPAVAEHLGVRVSDGWDAAIAGNLRLSDVLIESLADRLTLAPLRQATDTERLLVSSLRATSVGKVLTEMHEAVLVDCGAIDNDRTAENLSRLTQAMPVDGVYVVYDKRTTTPQELVNGTRQLRERGLNLLGMIENFIEA